MPGRSLSRSRLTERSLELTIRMPAGTCLGNRSVELSACRFRHHATSSVCQRLIASLVAAPQLRREFRMAILPLLTARHSVTSIAEMSIQELPSQVVRVRAGDQASVPHRLSDRYVLDEDLQPPREQRLCPVPGAGTPDQVIRVR